jgi:DNA mismatch repair protein MutL
LNITINPTLIDVNVHPRKAEIRFENEQNIFRCVYHAVLNTLEKVTLIETKVYETKRETKEDTV